MYVAGEGWVTWDDVRDEEGATAALYRLLLCSSNKVRRILPIGEMVKGCVLFKYMGNLRTP